MTSTCLLLLLAACDKKAMTTGPTTVQADEVAGHLAGSWYVVGSDEPTRLALDEGGSFALTAGADGGGPFAEMIAGGVTAGTWGADGDTLWFDGSVKRHELHLELLDGKLNVELDGVQLRRR